MPNDRQYELVYILAPSATDAEVDALRGVIDEHIQTLGGTVENTDLWGRRKLAYVIGNFTEGIYIVQLIVGPGEMITELERRLRVNDHVLRYLTVRVDEDLRKAQRAADKRKAAVERRRPTRGPLSESPAGSEAAETASVAPVAEPPVPTADDAGSELASAPAAADVESGAASTEESEATEE